MDNRQTSEFLREKRSLPLLESEAPSIFSSIPYPSLQSQPHSARISLTDRCDYACSYCRPSRKDGPSERRLPPSAWRSIFEGLKRAGVRRVRITGGEPLLFPEIVAIVLQLRALGFEDISLTTNGSQLLRLAHPLKEAGLSRVNISIDSLDRERFRELTRGGDLDEVLRGIDAALEAGLSPLKINTVVLKGINDDELEDILEWAWSKGLVPRFLELMSIGEGAKMKGHLMTVAEIRRVLSGYLREEEAQVEPMRGPAKYVHSKHDEGLRVGFISGASDTFCGQCDRLRISASGRLLPCLAMEDGVSAEYEALRGDADGIVARIHQAWAGKPDGRVWKGCNEESAGRISMRAVGG